MHSENYTNDQFLLVKQLIEYPKVQYMELLLFKHTFRDKI